MNRRREPCRNFQRGSCQYGDRCKFLHVTQQQSKPNPFGFGAPSTSQLQQAAQQQKPNPFGFGVPNNSRSSGAPNFSAKHQSPAKPFVNTWTRSSSVGQVNSTPSQRTERQPEPPVHKCTNPESCKNQIVEDFNNETPLWKLTCYGHCKYGPCDIVGDISFEELRATAYGDAKGGLMLQSLVERERSLLNSKLIEFENLLRNPYVSRAPSSANTGLFPGNASSSSLVGSQSNTPPSFSSFSQLGATTNLGSNTWTNSPGMQQVTISGQPSLFQNAQSSIVSGSQSSFSGQPSLFQNTRQTSGGFGMNSGMPGVFGSQLKAPQFGSSPGPSTSNFINGGVANTRAFPSTFQQFPSSFNQSPNLHDGPKVAANAVHETPVGEEHGVNSDDSIWLKKEWDIGEIPEEEPPPRFR